jgi:hypothetical protein
LLMASLFARRYSPQNVDVRSSAIAPVDKPTERSAGLMLST